MLLQKIPSFSYHGVGSSLRFFIFVTTSLRQVHPCMKVHTSSSCCLGILAETRSSSEKTLKSSFMRDHSSWGSKRQWSSSPREIENDASIFSYLDTHRPSLTSAAEDMKVAAENANNHSFFNQAAIAWNNMRQEWVGDRSKRCCRMRREPTVNRFSINNDLLSTTRHFPKPIPLSEMVEYLVDIWHEEGLYD